MKLASLLARWMRLPASSAVAPDTYYYEERIIGGTLYYKIHPAGGLHPVPPHIARKVRQVRREIHKLMGHDE